MLSIRWKLFGRVNSGNIQSVLKSVNSDPTYVLGPTRAAFVNIIISCAAMWIPFNIFFLNRCALKTSTIWHGFITAIEAMVCGASTRSITYCFCRKMSTWDRTRPRLVQWDGSNGRTWKKRLRRSMNHWLHGSNLSSDQVDSTTGGKICGIWRSTRITGRFTSLTN